MFIHGLIMTALLHIRVLKCVNGYQKHNLDAGLVMDVKLKFPGLHLTWILLTSFCGDMQKLRFMPAE
jgi:hypothetical protein